MIKKYIFLVLLLTIAVFLSTCEYEAYSQGKILYETQCANCHSESGTGLRNLIPPLAGADYLEKHPDEIACIIRNGMSGPIIVNDEEYDAIMAGNNVLTDVQINNIINYINHAWGNDYGISNVKEIEKQLEACQKD